MHIIRTISVLLLSVFLYSCASKSGMEDVSTGLYEKGGMSYLDKAATVPAKIYFDYDSWHIYCTVIWRYRFSNCSCNSNGSRRERNRFIF